LLTATLEPAKEGTWPKTKPGTFKIVVVTEQHKKKIGRIVGMKSPRQPCPSVMDSE